jgi:hypothetical protein
MPIVGATKSATAGAHAKNVVRRWYHAGDDALPPTHQVRRRTYGNIFQNSKKKIGQI